jgi:hypothetical protein
MLNGLRQLSSASLRHRAKTYLFSAGALTACLTLAKFDPVKRVDDAGWWIAFAIGVVAVVSRAVTPAKTIVEPPVSQARHEEDLLKRSLIRQSVR